ncbi:MULTISPECIES: CHAT domain-containing protein [unclassified Microcoleus]|uniref:CHAT domain-containing protein n=2 Tax=unclassified Microcoleus TaxID=2642155 RepID=UPI0025DFF2ED|nr:MULTISPECIES: CHAT domain-containing protein [unclassified Microcoleus]
MKMMKRLSPSVLVLGVCLTPLTVSMMVQPSSVQSQDSQYAKLKSLRHKATEETQKQPEQALATWEEVQAIARQIPDIDNQAVALNGIGEAYNRLSKMTEALESFKKALSILPPEGDSAAKAGTLKNIGMLYNSISQQTEALKYLDRALQMTKNIENKDLLITERVNNREEQARILIVIGQVHNSIYQQEKALKNFHDASLIMEETKNLAGKAVTLNDMGVAYKIMSKGKEEKKFAKITSLDKALKSFEKALEIRGEGDNSPEKATILSNIGEVYNNKNQPLKALEFLEKALTITEAFPYRAGKAVTLNQMGIAHKIMSQPQKALEYLERSLAITNEIGYRAGAADTFSNIAEVRRDMKQPDKAIDNWEKSVKITLEIRRDLRRENRRKFLEAESGPAIALTSLLIDQNDQNQDYRAFQWINIATTADLADYTRLIGAKVKDHEAQKAIDELDEKNKELQYLRSQLQGNLSENLSKDIPEKIRKVEAEFNKEAEHSRALFPEVAELFETTPKDIDQLKASIARDTVVIQPVLLENVRGVPNTIALFVLTKDYLTVQKVPIQPKQFDKLLTEHREEISNFLSAANKYQETGGKLYDFLIRPVEEKIQALSPKQLSIIATGKLRYIPFETLYDTKKNQFLIQKYPINYLTRISKMTIPDSTLRGPVLALGNPVTRAPYNLPNSKREVERITQIIPNSLPRTGNAATLKEFKDQARHFPFLHLATHGCFQPKGCCLLKSPNCKQPDRVDLKPNTILFANNEEFNIGDAALLRLENTRLLTLSACQTAIKTNYNDEEISGVAYVFERAGARAVIASLWNVADSSTKVLMVQFYQNINKGMSKNEALQQAKLSLIKDNFHPFFWSPFILIGDPR